MNTKRTIPVDLNDWLQHFRSSLEDHPFPKELTSGGNLAGQTIDGTDDVETSALTVETNHVFYFAA